MKHGTRHVLWMMTLVVLLSACGPTLEERKNKADLQYQIGISELKQGNLIEALAAFELGREHYTEDPKIHNALGLVYFQQQQYNKAVEQFKKTLRLEPNFVEAHNNLGSTYAQLKDWDNAIAEYRAVLGEPLYRTPELGHYNLGRVLLEKGQAIEAVKEFHTAVKIQPNFSRALNKYGVALFRLNRIQEAVKQFKQAIEIDPKYAEPYLNLGLAYMKQGKKEEAILQFKHILEHSRDEELTTSAQRYLEILE